MIGRLGAQFVRGFFMGSADVVPGVSGGTIALVLGIYTNLVHQIREGARVLGRLVKLDVRGAWRGLRELDWAFLLPLLAGIGAAVLSLAHLIETALDEQPVRTAAVFFGLVVGSIVVTIRDLGRLAPRRVVTLVVVAILTFTLLGLRSGPASDPSLLFVLLAGSVAICAMILPGVSGSFILLMIGMYDYVLGAVNDRDLVVAAVFGAGAVVGLAAFSSVLGWALERHERVLMAGLVGLMAGSLRVLWPWPEGTGGTTLEAPADDVTVPVVLMLVGAVAVVVLSQVAGYRQHDADVEAAHAFHE